jgi:hypothetical protein
MTSREIAAPGLDSSSRTVNEKTYHLVVFQQNFAWIYGEQGLPRNFECDILILSAFRYSYLLSGGVNCRGLSNTKQW